MKFMRYLSVGFKLFLVLLLAGLIMFLPRILSGFSILINTGVFWVLQVVLFVVGLIVAGALVIKFKKWIFR